MSSNWMGKILYFHIADIVESELSKVTTQPVLTQTTGKTSWTVPRRIAEDKTSVEGVHQPSVSSFETPGLGNIIIILQIWCWKIMLIILITIQVITVICKNSRSSFVLDIMTVDSQKTVIDPKVTVSTVKTGGQLSRLKGWERVSGLLWVISVFNRFASW